MKKNLILISLDTLRADVAYSGKFNNIERLRKGGISFLNSISSSPLTPVSHATVLTGLQPYNHGIRHLFKEQLRPDVKTLAQIFKDEGYNTGAVVSCPGVNRWYDFCRGFSHYDDEIPKLADGSDPLNTVDVKKRGTALKRADVVAARAASWLKKNKDKPFFLFIHFFDAHWPYEAPEKFGGDNIYEEEVAYSDHYLGLFLDLLQKEKITDKSAIVCFSDHGEDLNGLYPNDKGGEKLGHPEEFGHGCLLYDQTQKTLLILHDKELAAGKNIEQQVRLVDIMPTILEIFNIKYDKRQFDGISLLPIIRDNKQLNLIAYSETYYPEEQARATGKFQHARNLKAVRIKNEYKIIWQDRGDKVEVYNLKDDPMERNNSKL